MPSSSPELDARKKWALLQLQAAGDSSPVGHPLAAVARALQGMAGGYMAGEMGREDSALRSSFANDLTNAIGSPSEAAPQSPAPMMQQPAMPQPAASNQSNPYAGAIAGIESGGAYDKLGPVTKTGDRAYGKYQVMGANVGPWSKQHLGQAMTPQQFLASQQAQDAVFNGQFGSYANKYGPEGAAKAWFAGERGMNNPNARDQLGTTVAGYANKFNAGLQQPMPQGSQPPAQMAQAASPPQAPNRSQVAVPPAIMDFYKKYGANPRTGDRAMQVLAPYLKPTDRYEPVTDDKGNVIGQRSALTGEKKADPTRPDYQIQQRDDGAVVAVNKNDPKDFTVIKPAGASDDLVKHKGEVKRSEETGQIQGKGDAAVPGALENAQFINKTIEEIENHPGLKWGTGMSGVALRRMAGTDEYDFQSSVDQLKGRAFLDAFEALRGGGQISNVEGDKATAAKARLDTAQSEKAFRSALKDYTDVVKSAVTRVIKSSRTSPEAMKDITNTLGPKSEKTRATKSINGKNYFQQNGQWFEE